MPEQHLLILLGFLVCWVHIKCFMIWPTDLDLQESNSIAADSDHYISQESQQRHQPEAAGELLVLARRVKRETNHGGSSVVANEVPH